MKIVTHIIIRRKSKKQTHIATISIVSIESRPIGRQQIHGGCEHHLLAVASVCRIFESQSVGRVLVQVVCKQVYTRMLRKGESISPASAPQSGPYIRTALLCERCEHFGCSPIHHGGTRITCSTFISVSSQHYNQRNQQPHQLNLNMCVKNKRERCCYSAGRATDSTLSIQLLIEVLSLLYGMLDSAGVHVRLCVRV